MIFSDNGSPASQTAEPSPESTEGSTDSFTNRLESALTQYKLAQFHEARVALESLLDSAQSKMTSNPLEITAGDQLAEVSTLLVRIYFEQDQNQKLESTQKLLEKMILNPSSHSPLALGKVYVTLGVLVHKKELNIEKAQALFSKSVQLAIENHHLRTLAFATYGMANTYLDKGEIANCLRELDKLEEILIISEQPDLATSGLILTAFVYRDQNQNDIAQELLHQALRKLRDYPNLYLFLYSLYAMGSLHMRTEEFLKAELYLELGRSTCSKSELPKLHRQISETLEKCLRNHSANREQELIFNSSKGEVQRTGVGTVSLQSQFILTDLLSLFLKNPGRAFSKEDLIQQIWKEDYNPMVHDNKIYVTMKRLKEVLSPLFGQDDPIIRKRNGYSFNQQMNIRIINQDSTREKK